MKHISYSEKDTKKLGKFLASHLGKKRNAVLLLEGGLGAGKSFLARQIIRELMQNQDLEVPSPTFTLVQTYETGEGINIWHYDLYRLEDPSEIIELGFEDALSEGIIIVEWPDRLGDFIPKEYIKITINHDDQDDNKRNIIIEGIDD